MATIRGVDPRELFESRSWAAIKKAILTDLEFARNKLEMADPSDAGQIGRYQGQIEVLKKLLALPEHYEDTQPNKEDS